MIHLQCCWLMTFSHMRAWRDADLARAFETSGKTQLSVMEVNGSDISKYGVVVPNGEPGSVAGLVENQTQTKHPPT